MEVKPGYKQTEVGVIPEEWEVKLLPEVLHFRGGKAHEQHISETGRYICVNSKFISTDGEVRKYSSANFCPANKGDVLMVMSDLPNGRALAKAYLVDRNDTYAVNQRVCALTAYRDCPKYFFYVLNRHPYFLKFDNGVSQTHLLNNVFQKCPIPVPPNVDEQRAIATALSDVDGLLSGLDRLIAKKRDLKQAAMQQLLTGQIRLPGFHGQWETATIGDVCSFSGGSQPPRSAFRFKPTTGYVRLIQIRDYKADDFASYIPEHLARKRCTCNDIMIGRYGPPIFQILRGLEGAYNVALIKTTLSPKVDVDFFFNVLNQEPLFQLIESLSRRSSGQTGVEIPALKAYRLPLPTHPEQIAIAEVLTEMDAELAALEQRREKTRALKQAMMQELLTGKTRLV